MMGGGGGGGEYSLIEVYLCLVFRGWYSQYKNLITRK